MNKIITTGCMALAAAAALAMPSKQELTKAKPVVEEITSADLAAFKAGEKTAKNVAVAHIAAAQRTENQAEKYLLCQGAFKLYARSGEYDLAADTIQIMKRDVKDIPPDVIAEIISDELRYVSDDKAPRLVALLNEAKGAASATGEGAQVAEVTNAVAVDGKEMVNDYTWSYRIKNGEAEIVAEKDGKFTCAVSPAPKGNLLIPSMLGGVRVTSVGSQCFDGCKEMTSVTIPDGVTSLGYKSFWACGGLKSATLPSSLKSIGNGAFGGHCALESLKIPQGVTSIGFQAFHYGKLRNLTIPASVTSLGDAFEHCDELSRVTILGERPNAPDGVVFKSCGKLKELHVYMDAKSWSGMKDWLGVPLVFHGQESVNGYTWSYGVINGEATIEATKDDNFVCAVSPRPKGHLTIPATLGGTKVNTIGFAAIADCGELESVEIPSGITKVDGAAFNSSGMKTITVPSSVTNMGGCVSCCGKLEAFRVAADNPVYSSRNGLLCSKDGETVHLGVCGDVVVPDGVVHIAPGAFWRMGLKSIVIPASVKDISSYGIYACGVESVTMLGERPSVPPSVLWGCGSAKVHVSANAKSWAGMKEWQDRPLVFDAEKALRNGYERTATVDGYTWSYRVKNGEATIVAEKDGKPTIAVSPKLKGDVAIPEVIEGSKVVRIGAGAFWGCDGLKTVSIPSIVESIGDGAFGYCFNLGEVNIPDGVKRIEAHVFQRCALKSVAIPSSVTSICNQAFLGCNGIKSVTISNGVKSIEGAAFAECKSLVTVEIPESVERIDAGAFSDCGASRSFSVDPHNPAYCSKNGLLCSKDGTILVAGIVGDVTIPEGVTKIGDRAFIGHCELKSVTLPSTLKVIGDSAFAHCKSLSSLMIPSSVTDICANAFHSCSALSLTIPPNVKNLPQCVFAHCSALKSIAIPEGVTNMAWGAFLDCGGLKAMTIPASVKHMSKGVFEDCVELSSITMLGERPDAEGAFFKCPKLAEIHVPANEKSWAGMKEWQGKKLVFDAK